MPVLLPEDLARPLPRLLRVRQRFDEGHLADVAAAVGAELSRLCEISPPPAGARVAVAVGSRGIRNLRLIVETAAAFLKGRGLRPFIVSAMGSHGGGTAAGQREVLAGYGISEDALGVPVVTEVDTVELGRCQSGAPVWFDRAALSADLILPVNRVKLHTDFTGPLQSGICKMLVIGLGNHKGCSAVHEEDFSVFASAIEERARLIMTKAPVWGGLALVENAYDQTCLVKALPAATLVEEEKELVQLAKARMPFIRLPEADVIVCRRIGKEISGAGFDPNILGRSSALHSFVLPVPRYQKLVLTELSEASHGNGIGIGLFDVVTRRAAQQVDWETTYANAVACNCLGDASLPCVAEDEETALRIALKCCRGIDRDEPRVIRIADTLHLEYIEVSQALLPAVMADPELELIEE